MKNKKLLLSAAVCTLAFTSRMEVYAEPLMTADGIVFDAEYYADTYADVKAVFGTDEQALYGHYLQYGISEGRSPASAQAVAELQNGSSSANDALIEEGDENYWRAGCVSVGYDTAYIIGCTEWLHEDPANGMVRMDMKADPYYQIIRNEIIAALAASENKTNITHYSNYHYNPGNWENEKHYRQVRFNLAIDLVKEGVLKRCYLMDNPADGAAHYGGVMDYDFITICYLNYDYGDEDIVHAQHPELKGYY